MRRIDTIVVGAGQAGLAASCRLSEHGREHLVLDRSSVAHSWSTRWDSLRLLTPNWQTRLPGWRYCGNDPDGFMTSSEVQAHLRRYAQSIEAPVHEGIEVCSVIPDPAGFCVRTSDGEWRATNVVIATGHAQTARTPDWASSVDPSIHQITSTSYRRPDDVARGGVLVVGASASGVQIADELARAGRDVILAVGRHNRMSRQHRGRDIMSWLDRLGHFDTVLPRPSAHVGSRSRSTNSLQLVGSLDRRNLDLETLQSSGVQLVGRCLGIDGARAAFGSDLEILARDADTRLRALLARIDEFIERTGEPAEPLAGGSVRPAACSTAATHIDLHDRGVTTIVWATGFRRDYSWLRVPGAVADAELVHRHGVLDVEGLYAVGLQRQRTRKSTFIDGVGADAAIVVDHLVSRRLRRAERALRGDEPCAPTPWPPISRYDSSVVKTTSEMS